MAESELISQARAGDGAALGRLLRARQDKLYRTAFLYTRNQADALDVVQETALQAMLSIKRLRHPEYFDTWLIRILINSAYRLMRSRKPVGDEAARCSGESGQCGRAASGSGPGFGRPAGETAGRGDPAFFQ